MPSFVMPTSSDVRYGNTRNKYFRLSVVATSFSTDCNLSRTIFASSSRFLYSSLLVISVRGRPLSPGIRLKICVTAGVKNAIQNMLKSNLQLII